MTIDISANNPRISYSVAAGVTQTSFAVPFEFFDDSDLNVYIDTTLQTITTNYTVTGGAGSTGTVTMSVTGPKTVIFTRDTTIERTTDFTAGVDINRAALNTQLDTLTAISADNKDLGERSIRITDYDPAASNLLLPDAATRADKLLSFDTEGDIQVQAASDLLTGSVLGANYTKASHTGNGTIVAFSTTEAAGSKNNIQVYIDGVYQNKDTFSISGSTLTFTEAPPLNSAIEFIVGNAVTSLTTDPDVVTYNQGSTGAQDRTLTSKLQETVSVKDFGAVGNGTTDDTAAFEAALSITGSVLVPKGTYRITAPLTVGTGQVMYGTGDLFAGGSSTILLDDSSAKLIIKGSIGGLQGLYIDGNNTAVRCVDFDATTRNWKIEKCYITGATNWGIHIGDGTNNNYSGEILNCIITGNSKNVYNSSQAITFMGTDVTGSTGGVGINNVASGGFTFLGGSLQNPASGFGHLTNAGEARIIGPYIEGAEGGATAFICTGSGRLSVSQTNNFNIAGDGFDAQNTSTISIDNVFITANNAVGQGFIKSTDTGRVILGQNIFFETDGDLEFFFEEGDAPTDNFPVVFPTARTIAEWDGTSTTGLSTSGSSISLDTSTTRTFGSSIKITGDGVDTTPSIFWSAEFKGMQDALVAVSVVCQWDTNTTGNGKPFLRFGDNGVGNVLVSNNNTASKETENEWGHLVCIGRINSEASFIGFELLTSLDATGASDDFVYVDRIRVMELNGYY